MTASSGSIGQQVAREIIAIRAALGARGYAIRKQPRQAVWMIQASPSQSYRLTFRLTFQPRPISAWVLHPQDHSQPRQEILHIIRSAFQQRHHRSCR